MRNFNKQKIIKVQLELFPHKYIYIYIIVFSKLFDHKTVVYDPKQYYNHLGK